MYSDLLTGDLTDKRFYGIYRGIVVDNTDPEGLLRIKLRVPQLLGSAVTSWAWGIHPPITGNIFIPQPGTGVFVMFEGGDPNFPLWLGAY